MSRSARETIVRAVGEDRRKRRVVGQVVGRRTRGKILGSVCKHSEPASIERAFFRGRFARRRSRETTPRALRIRSSCVRKSPTGRLGNESRVLNTSEKSSVRPRGLSGSCAERRTHSRLAVGAGERCSRVDSPPWCRRRWSVGATRGRAHLRDGARLRQHVVLGLPLTHDARGARGSCRGTRS